MTKPCIRAMESGSRPYSDYQSKQERKECIGSTFYCVISLAVFVAAFVLSDPNIVAAIPGGAITSAIISIGIFLTVIFLCIKQAPKRPTASEKS